MIIDMTEVEEIQYVREAGEHLLKVIEVIEGRTTKQGNQVLKVVFENKDKLRHIEDFVLTDAAMYRLKILTKALKMPNVVDTRMMLDRFVVAELVQERYTKGDGTEGVKLTAKSWKPSKLTNSLEEPEPVLSHDQLPVIDVNEETIPF